MFQQLPAGWPQGALVPAAPAPATRVELSVVAPCFNEELTLDELYRRVTEACRRAGKTYEIVLVNDGSRDGTWPLMQRLAAADEHLLCVNLSRNHGHQLALSAGLALCSGERALILDADLQDPPELLPAMIERMDAGFDVVYGKRRARAGEHVAFRVAAAVFYRLLSRLSEVPVPLDTGDFRLVSRRALDVLLSMPERHRFIRGMISWIGFSQEAFPYDRQPRAAGTTHYGFWKLLRLAVDGITALSIRPLQVASWIGLVTGVFAVALFGYSLVGWLQGAQVAGWSSLMAAIAIVSSVELFVLGIIGEYLGRLYEQTKGRPLFVVESVLRGGPGKKPDAPP
jgi:polyisoprenyl-phosphate glycosyltransferase